MSNEGKHYVKDIEIKCDSDEHHTGRNLLYFAFRENAGNSRTYKSFRGGPGIVMNETTPLYWEISSPLLYRRQFFSQKAAETIARPIVAFLEANGVTVTRDLPPAYNRPWGANGLVSVFTGGANSAPEASDLPTVAMLPATFRHVWELVRYPEDRPKLG